MSEYQYYEWQTIDRPLTANEVAEVDRLSSHMDVVTSTQAIVTYSWGDFKHDPKSVLLKYFDAMLYLANWGSRQLMFRFPKTAIDVDAIQPYCLEEWTTLESNDEFYVLEFSFDEEEGLDWVEGEGTLGQLIPLREQIIQGDYRVLYLAWLKAISLDEPDVAEVEPEPPISAGLKNLSSSLHTFIEVFGLDPHLVSAAAKASPETQPVSETPLEHAISQLSREECEDYLLRILHKEPQVRSALRKRLAELAGLTLPVSPRTGRTAGELFQKAKRAEQKENQRKKVEAERKRVQELQELAYREEATWQRVEDLIGQKQAKPYDEAMALLVKLRELAIF